MQLSTRLPPLIPVLCLVLSIFLTTPAWTVAGGASDLSVALPAVAVGAGEDQQQCLPLPRTPWVLCAGPVVGRGLAGSGVTCVAPLGRFVCSTSASGPPQCYGELWPAR